MSEFTEPQIIDFCYMDSARAWFVSPVGSIYGRELPVSEPIAESVVSLFEQRHLSLEELAWVSFYKHAFIKLKHTHSDKDQIEYITGEKIKTAVRDQFVVDRRDDTLKFSDKPTILESGELTLYMANWIGRALINEEQPDIDPILDFEPLLHKVLT